MQMINRPMVEEEHRTIQHRVMTLHPRTQHQMDHRHGPHGH